MRAESAAGVAHSRIRGVHHKVSTIQGPQSRVRTEKRAGSFWLCISMQLERFRASCCDSVIRLVAEEA